MKGKYIPERAHLGNSGLDYMDELESRGINGEDLIQELEDFDNAIKNESARPREPLGYPKYDDLDRFDSQLGEILYQPQDPVLSDSAKNLDNFDLDDIANNTSQMFELSLEQDLPEYEFAVRISKMLDKGWVTAYRFAEKGDIKSTLNSTNRLEKLTDSYLRLSKSAYVKLMKRIQNSDGKEKHILDKNIPLYEHLVRVATTESQHFEENSNDYLELAKRKQR